MRLFRSWSYQQNSALKSGSSILIAVQMHGFILEKMASPDLLILTPPSILMTSVPMSRSKPYSWPSTTRASTFTVSMLSMSMWWFQHRARRELCHQLLAFPFFVDSRGLHTYPFTRDREDLWSTSIMCLIPSIWTLITGSNSLKMFGDRLAPTFRLLSPFRGHLDAIWLISWHLHSLTLFARGHCSPLLTVSCKVVQFGAFVARNYDMISRLIEGGGIYCP